ncbi:unnamed protein product [Adineta ricciae]|uniref:Uncharacterized protein n=1 Tax=Adineta ricciae TaxID=249248 RepID=A0A814SQ70_ADIRI|nr:unnamed protein product [Adineta ricciae]
MAELRTSDFQPGFVIAWLDVNMGQLNNNEASKNELASSANLSCAPANAQFDNINHLIQQSSTGLGNGAVNSLIKDVLRMFTERQQCIDFVRQSLDAKKKVFLIVSGSIGAPVVRELHQKLSGCIYVFCGDRNAHPWTDEYSQHLVVYDDELGVFANVLSDIGIYYLQKADEKSCSVEDAIRYLHWARQFFYRARRLDGVKREEYIEMVDDAIQERNNSLPNPIEFDDDTMDFTSQEAMD